MSEDFQFTISDEARPFLILQKGYLWDLKDDHKLWDAAYTQSINNYFRTLSGHLPENCGAVLDMGSGLGGINAILAQHYDNLSVTLLDGVNDKAEVRLHSQTFNAMSTAERFLRAHGVERFDYIDPNNLPVGKMSDAGFDLIISAGAWGFHFFPQEYLDMVKFLARPGATIILDVRKSRPEWLEQLTDAFGPGEIIRDATKFTKWKFINGKN